MSLRASPSLRVRTAVSLFRLIPLTAVFLFCANTEPVLAGSKGRLVELKDSEKTYLGRIVAKNSEHCYLMNTFGEMHFLAIADLQSLRVVEDTFRPASGADFRRQLHAEFAAGYETENSSHYIVVGRKGRAKVYATLFEDIYRQVTSFYSFRGFTTEEPDLPLVAIVFGTQEEFREYCTRDQVVWSKDLRGYYSLKSNRVALFDDPSALTVVSMNDRMMMPAESGKSSVPDEAVTDDAGPVVSTAALYNSVAGETASTIVHETTHQVGYNIGIHSRVTETPAWIIEGLATVLEAPGMRARGKSSSVTRMNAGRLKWFQGDYADRRQPGDLALMIASDDIFRSQPFDAYSTAWAFSYYMTENPARARSFVRYLKMIGDRDPMKVYPPEERLKDFQSVFGDISRIDAEFLRASGEWSEENSSIAQSGKR